MLKLRGDVMFVSSYSTYITSNSSDKTSKITQDRLQNEKDSFSSKLSTKETPSIQKFRTTLPINYISTNKAFVNKQELDYQSSDKKDTQIKHTKKLTDILSKESSNINFKSAYQDNLVMFSFLQKPQSTLNQTPIVNQIQEKSVRHTMVNTYIANDNYYKITA